jgi:hypothetical protein
VWGVIWLFIAFCFFVAGIIIGLVAFKVHLASTSETDCTIDMRRCVGIDCAAERGCEALLAYAWLERCTPAAGICTAGTALQRAVVRGSCIAVITHVA